MMFHLISTVKRVRNAWRKSQRWCLHIQRATLEIVIANLLTAHVCNVSLEKVWKTTTTQHTQTHLRSRSTLNTFSFQIIPPTRYHNYGNTLPLFTFILVLQSGTGGKTVDCMNGNNEWRHQANGKRHRANKEISNKKKLFCVRGTSIFAWREQKKEENINVEENGREQ